MRLSKIFNLIFILLMKIELFLHTSWTGREKFIAEVAAISSYEHYKRALNDLKIANRFLLRQKLKTWKRLCCRRLALRFFCGIYLLSFLFAYAIWYWEGYCSREGKILSFRGVKIGIMGCVVNGPGEMADAHYGIVGYGKDRAAVYKGKQAISKSLPWRRYCNY